jgi:hypothetical protein
MRNANTERIDEFVSEVERKDKQKLSSNLKV